MVFEKYLTPPDSIVTEDIVLPKSYMGGRVKVNWTSEREDILSSDGKLGSFTEPAYIKFTAELTIGSESMVEDYYINVIPKITVPYKMTIHADRETIDISDTLYGLFYEDINNAADGGLYAELVNNRSFEAFTYNTYDFTSGENGKSTGRNHTPLKFWFGTLDKVTPKCTGGLNEFLKITKPDTNEYYLSVKDGACLYNRGFCDEGEMLSMFIKEGVRYDFTIWARSDTDSEAVITAQLVDAKDIGLSSKASVNVSGGWRKYGVKEKCVLTAAYTGYAQLKLEFKGDVSIDMVSLMPEDVWGANQEKTSETAHDNYWCNPNYRLRRDLVEAMQDLHPKFLRFPGGCISEGSYIWDNVYDWKDSVDDVEYRRENYNVWGYMMTMGLGYMEYFQLAEDLGASPLPVMACGVLCQARSDYANPAGGELQKKYIDNFTDLIDFAISTDFANNKWAALRKNMGHEKPFDLHLLGVGNENWGEEFFASFQDFKYVIDRHMRKYYPGYELTIISTVGAQADDDAYKYGWRFLSGNLKESGARVTFTDGEQSFDRDVKWYEHEDNYMETIADEHYYRPNTYLYENVDRYNYYYRAYNEDGTLNEEETSKVFVVDYASTDKNTLAGAVAEAAVMTGFENNSDVVRLSATAPLFNKVLYDGSYRWTPDAIWFDNASVWRTPNYYVQQMFAKYIGRKAVDTTFTLYDRGEETKLSPRGGIEIAVDTADMLIKEVCVTSNKDKSVLLRQDFTEKLDNRWQFLGEYEGTNIEEGRGLILKAGAGGLNGIYMLNDEWSDYTLTVKAVRVGGSGGIYIGAGLTGVIDEEHKDVLVYSVCMDDEVTGLRVIKRGVEGYCLGDYSSSVTAGNLRECNYEAISNDTEYEFIVNYGCEDGRHIRCEYHDLSGFNSKVLEYKLEAYNRQIFSSVTKDDEHIYAKLVNAHNVPRKLDIMLDGYRQTASVKMIILTADASLVNVDNVNTKDCERVRPNEYELAVNEQKVQVFLPANSVSVLVF